MTTQPGDRYLMARLRAGGTVRRPTDRAELSALRTAAHRAERRLVEVSGQLEAASLIGAWPVDDDPLSREDEAPYFRSLSPTDLLVLAVCIRWCWQDSQAPMYPGAVVSESEVLDALQDLSPSSHMATLQALRTIRGNHKSSIERLTACRYLERSHPVCQLVLGPMLALWSDEDVSALRAQLHRIPGPLVEEV